MDATRKQQLHAAQDAALEALRHNAHGPFQDLPRAAGWGYPEPYTRDLMISSLGILISEDRPLIGVAQRVLETLAQNQSAHGHIPSLVHDPQDRGSSDTTPLFLLALGAYRQATGEHRFLQDAAGKALEWMRYQSPTDRYLVAQQPTSDWRDEQWVLGHGLFVNTVLYSALRLLGEHEWADGLRQELCGLCASGGPLDPHEPEGLAIEGKPYYALWSYKIYSSERFDLLGNSFAVLSGISSDSQPSEMVDWIESRCAEMRQAGDLALDLPPNFFPYIRPGDPDWRPRYQDYNQPGEYHNGGIWPFVCAFYVAALVAAKEWERAEEKLLALTDLIHPSRDPSLAFGFNEWFKAQDGRPMGQDWQTWSAAMYLYAAKCVEERSTPFFDSTRTR